MNSACTPLLFYFPLILSILYSLSKLFIGILWLLVYQITALHLYNLFCKGFHLCHLPGSDSVLPPQCGPASQWTVYSRSPSERVSLTTSVLYIRQWYFLPPEAGRDVFNALLLELWFSGNKDPFPMSLSQNLHHPWRSSAIGIRARPPSSSQIIDNILLTDPSIATRRVPIAFCAKITRPKTAQPATWSDLVLISAPRTIFVTCPVFSLF